MRVQAPHAAHPSRRTRPGHAGVAHPMPLVPAAPRAVGKISTAQDVFDAMRDVFRKDKAKGMKVTYEFDVTGSGGGTWWIVIDDGTCTMGTGGAPGKADVKLHVSAGDWVKIANEELGSTRAFLTGRLKIEGDRRLAEKLDEIFP